MPAKVNVSKIKAKLLRPALTSHFIVQIPKPKFPDDYLSNNGISNFDQEQLNLLCSEATLPGSSLATHENNSDFPGVTQKFAYRRLYDDRIDFTFYVNADNYLPIVYFESWIKFIVGESKSADKRSGKLEIKSSEYFYRVKYPDDYIAQSGLKVTKFERTSKSEKSANHEGATLTYNFVSAYPIAVTSMPVSYDASSLLKCTVSFSYIRYYIESLRGSTETETPGSRTVTRSPNGAADSPFTGAQLDNIEALDIEYTQALASGNNDRIEAADIAVTQFQQSFVTTGAGGADQQQDIKNKGFDPFGLPTKSRTLTSPILPPGGTGILPGQ
jgi:hypothetical protein